MLLAITPCAWAKGLAFHSSTDGFSLTLPAGWVQIPRAEIVQTASAMSNAAPNVRPFVPSYAFQQSHSGSGFNYPYILITIRGGGRPPEAGLRKLASTSFSELGNGMRGKLTNLMTQVRVGQPVLDNDTNIIWFSLSSRVNKLGEARGIVALIPTAHGIIQIQGYARADSFKAFLSEFVAVIGSIKLDASMRY